jgi:ABC-type sugar transport system ATPase subunit
LRDITKTYPGVNALRGLDLDVYSGEVHALVGENGAGKSTLLKIACGAHAPTSGTVELNGYKVEFEHPIAARAAGIAAVYQELTTIPALSAMANVFLGREKRKFGFLGRAEMLRDFQTLQRQLDVNIDPDRPAGRLSVADQQSLEIMRGLAADAKILILDEPTAAIGPSEREALYVIIRRLRSHGVAILLISHDLDEVLDLSDRITVLRDGRAVGSKPRDEWSKAGLVEAMLGEGRAANVAAQVRQAQAHGDELLRAENIRVPGKVDDVSFSVKRGEIVGFAGLVGSGRTELLRSLVGMEPGSSGKLSVSGKEIGWPRNPRSALHHGMALAPEDRKRQGLILGLPSYANVTLTNPWKGSRFGLLSPRSEINRTRPVTERLALQAGALKRRAKTLSGGNQQKLILAKWLEAKVDILLVDEPTRGVDVGAKMELFGVLESLAESGVAVVLVSSELEEVVANSDRVLVLSRGKLVGEIEGRTTTKEDVLKIIFAAETTGA